MKGAAPLTPLGYALLGLLRAGPGSGYALRMVFETTPLGVYSSSPGSIYPALAKLEKLGLVARGSGAGGEKGAFMLTAPGEAALAAWLAKPVEPEEVARDVAPALLRFAFLEHGDPALALRFLESFEAATRARAAELDAYLASEAGAALPLHGRLAVEHGLSAINSSADWAAGAHRRLRQAAPKETE